MNLDNKIKTKIINHQAITEEELKAFIDYIIYKSNIITQHMTNIKSYTQINLCNEILWSHNLDSTIYHHHNKYYCIFNINDKDYLLDIDFKDNRLPSLSKNKYIELTNEIYNKYLEVIGG